MNKWFFFVVCVLFIPVLCFSQAPLGRTGNNDGLTTSTSLAYDVLDTAGGIDKLNPTIFLGIDRIINPDDMDGSIFGFRFGPTFSTVNRGFEVNEQIRTLLGPGNINISLIPSYRSPLLLRTLYAEAFLSGSIKGSVYYLQDNITKAISKDTIWGYSFKTAIGIVAPEIGSIIISYRLSYDGLFPKEDYSNLFFG